MESFGSFALLMRVAYTFPCVLREVNDESFTHRFALVLYYKRDVIIRASARSNAIYAMLKNVSLFAIYCFNFSLSKRFDVDI